jgi:hypothetical protein
MFIALTIAAAVVLAFGGVIGWMYLRARALGPAVYRDLSLTDLEPFFRSWGVWLGNRGEILVRHKDAEPIVHFRKRTYRRRPNILLFRYRNADESRGSFSVVRAALETAGVDHEVELTRRTRQPRALVVPLDPSDVLMPAAATRLLNTVFRALRVDAMAGFLVWSEGRFQPRPDREDVPLIAPSAAQRAGFRMGVALGKLARAVQLSRS